jgi:hypothetical protein
MNHEESQIQTSFIDWINLQHPKLACFVIHIPNGGKMNPIRGRRLKRMGVKAGVADILFMWHKKEFGGLWLEFKSGKGCQGEQQKIFEGLCKIAQYDYQIVRSLDEAISAFTEYMELS